MVNFSKREKIKSIVLFLTLIFCQFFTYPIFDFLGTQLSEISMTLGGHIFMVLLTAFCFRKGLLEDFKALKGQFWTGLKAVVPTMVLGIFVEYAVAMFCVLIVPAQDAEVSQTLSEVVLFTIAAIFLAPISEELIFRYGLFNTLYPRSRKAAYIVTAVLFGLMHVWEEIFALDFAGMFAMVPRIVFGLYAAQIYEKSKNICYPMLYHAMNNAIASSLKILLLLFGT